MNISYNTYDSIETLIFNEGLRINSLSFDELYSKMLVNLNNNSTIIINTQYYPYFKNATQEQLQNYSLISNGIGIHWPDLNEDLSLKGFLSDILRQLVKSKDELVIS